ncbi:protein NLRC5 isoform X5 [Carassius gibelio]|uniref:protein NLRC5 isoform X5 n=1 Tax=Carassius gibelio TaxID=101364 RepID=UPI002277B1DC|nr:protein NLRC5 isoform X5 [Carassius gibelio]
MSFLKKQRESSDSEVSSSESVKSDQLKDDIPVFNEETSTKSVRSGSHLSSSVSVKSDYSKGDGPNFSEKTPCNKSVRSGSHLSSSVSVKSDYSKGDGPNFSEKTPCNKSVRSGSHVSSSVSVKSDRSKGDGPNFPAETPFKNSVRSGSLVSSSMSVKSDRSKGDGPNFSEKKTSPSKGVRSGSHVSSSVSVKSDCSKGHGPNFSGKTPCNKSERSESHVSSSVSMKSDHSKGDRPNFSEKTPSPSQSNKGHKSTVNIGEEITRWDALKAQKGLKSDVQLATYLLNRVQFEKSDSNYKNYRNRKNFIDNLLWIFKDLEKKIIAFLKNELEKFKKILNRENTQYFVQDFIEEMRDIKEAALDITLYFLRDMKQCEAADALQDELFLIHQRPLKSNLKKKYQSVSEGIAKHGDSKLLKNIYTDLCMTLSVSKQVNIQNEVGQVQAADRRHESKEIPVECKNLFEAPEPDKEIRTVLTTGVAGIGKSVSVQKFILDWADGKENQDITFIFPLAFREMNLKEKETQSLTRLISQFFPEIKGLNLARNDKFKLLFILDGLDECRLPLNFEGNEICRDVTSQVSLDVLLTNLIKGNLLPSALIWITTRPAAAIKIPPECVDRMTEVQGFNDAQKEEYFRKRFTDGDLASEIIGNVKQSKSLFVMCYIPVFCWITATVLQNILEEKRNNEVKNYQADDFSKTLQESNTVDTPKTLTQMYTHFVRFQMLQSRRKYDGEYTPDVYWDKDAMLSLGKLAFHQLQRNNLLFYDTDLESCDIDKSKASVYSSMCTQIFKEEKGIILGTAFCFVHLSIQEFIAALYAHLFLDIHKKSVFNQHESTELKKKNEIMIDLLKTAVDKALESETGHLDLFLRFLLGLSLQTNHPLFQGLLTEQDVNDENYKEIVQYIKDKLEANLSPERSINLFYCLNELNDQTLVEKIQTQLREGSLSSADLSPAQWSAVAFVLLTSEEEMEEFELQKFKQSDECLFRLLEVVKISKRALLNDCNLTDESCSNLAKALKSDNSLIELNMSNNNLKDSGVKQLCIGLGNITCKLEILKLSNCYLTEESCSALASDLSSDSSSLKELDLSNNNLQDSGVTLLSDGVKEKCKLEKLGLSDCGITEEGYKALASALRSNPSHMIELDLTGNDPGESGVKELSDLLQDPNCQLKTLRFLGPAAEKACQYLAGFVNENPLLLRKLNLSEHKLDLNQLAPLLLDKHCKLNKLVLNNSSITDEDCCVLAEALNSNPSNLKELDLTGTKLRDTGMKIFSTLFENEQCKLEKIKFNNICITKEGCAALTAAFNSNPSNLIELDLSENSLGDPGVAEISKLLGNSLFTLKILRMSNCSITEEGYKALASALRSNPSHLVELDLRGNDPGQSGVKELLDSVKGPVCKLKLRFLGPAADEACQYVERVVGKNPLLLRQLNLSNLEDSNVKKLAALLQDKHCKLNKLKLNNNSITEEGCIALTSAFNLNPSNLIELDLSGNKLQNSGIEKLCHLLRNPQCRLKKLKLSDCSITEEGYKALASALRSNPSHLIELDLRGNDPGQSGVKELNVVPQKPDCKLKLKFLKSPAAEQACDYLTEVLGKSPLLLKELDLSEDKLGDLDGEKLSALLMDSHNKVEKIKLNNCRLTDNSCSVLATVLSSKTILKEMNLNNSRLLDSGVKEICEGLKNPVCELKTLKLCKCDLTEESCSALASVLRSDSSSLKDLDLSNNNLQDSGVKLLTDGLKENCKLQKLKLSNCSITEEGYKALASALRSNPSHLIELNLTGNDPGQSGVKELTDLLQEPNCKLILRFLSSEAEEACQYVIRVVNKNPLLVRELNLSKHKLDSTHKVIQLAALLEDKHCKLNIIQMNKNSITEEGCAALTSAFNSNPSNLTELDLSGNKLGNTGIQKICLLLENPQCKLEKLKLSDCGINGENYKTLISVLRSSPSRLTKLDLTGNYPGKLGLQWLFKLLKGAMGNLMNISFLSPAAEEAYEYLFNILGTNPLLLQELDLSTIKLGDLDWEKLAALLPDSHCIVEKIKLNTCELTEKSCSVLATVLSSKPNLKEMNLNNSRLLDSGVKQICEGLKKSKLEILKLSNCSITEEGYKALASALRSNRSHLKELDLTGNDPGQSGVKELVNVLQGYLCKLRFLQSPAAVEACQYVTRVLCIKDPLTLSELNLSKHKLELKNVEQLAALMQDKHCRLNKLQLCDCDLTEESCLVLATVLRSNSSLKELDMSNNNLKDSGIKKLQNGLENKNCTLQKLRLSDCGITEEGYKALASALRSNPLHLIELDLTGNDPGQSGVKELTDLLQDPNCQLKILRFFGPDAERASEYVPGLVGKNLLLVKELNLSDVKLGDTRVNQIAALLRNKHCQLNTIFLCRCSITQKQCLILTSALKSNPSHLRELDLSGNKINTGVNHLCDILRYSHSKLERLRFSGCEIKDEGCSAVSSALKSNPSHLRELDLSGNHLGDSGVKNISDLLMNPRCKLEILNLCGCSITEKYCLSLTSALKSNPSHLRELDLSVNQINKTGVNHLCDVLKDSACKLERLRFRGCEMTDEGCSALTSALKSNPSHLRELDLSGNQLGDSGVKNISDLLMNPQCKLGKLALCGCSITEKQCLILTSALKSNPSHLRELELSGNKIENTGVNHLCDVLKSSHCKLERLSLNDCGITDVSYLAQSLDKKTSLHFLKELDLSNNKIVNSKTQLTEVLKESGCELRLDRESWLITGLKRIGGWFGYSRRCTNRTLQAQVDRRTDEYSKQETGSSV